MEIWIEVVKGAFLILSIASIFIGIKLISPQLKEILIAIKSIKWRGLEFNFNSKNQSENISLKNGISKESMDTGLEDDTERGIIDSIPNDISNDKKISFLIRELSSTKISSLLDKILAGLYGTQIELLKTIREKGFVTIDWLNDYYFHVEDSFPRYYLGSSPSKYMEYLFNSGLLEQDKQKTTLSKRGLALLKYIEFKYPSGLKKNF